MTMIDEKLVEAAQKATTTRIDLVSGYYLFQHKPTDMTCSIHAPDGLHIGNLLANEAGDFAAEITSLRAGLAIAKPVAEPVTGWVLMPDDLTPGIREATWRAQYQHVGAKDDMPANVIDECVRRKMEDPGQEVQDRAAYRAMLAASKDAG